MCVFLVIPSRHRVSTKVKFLETDERILPEMSAKVTFIKRAIENAIMIPQTAALEVAEGHAVFLVTKAGVAQKRKIEIADNANEMALVANGLSAGETLVTSGQRSLVDGDKVEVSHHSE